MYNLLLNNPLFMLKLFLFVFVYVLFMICFVFKERANVYFSNSKLSLFLNAVCVLFCFVFTLY